MANYMLVTLPLGNISVWYIYSFCSLMVFHLNHAYLLAMSLQWPRGAYLILWMRNISSAHGSRSNRVRLWCFFRMTSCLTYSFMRISRDYVTLLLKINDNVFGLVVAIMQSVDISVVLSQDFEVDSLDQFLIHKDMPIITCKWAIDNMRKSSLQIISYDILFY